MEPYWTYKFKIELRGEDEHTVKLYKYSEKSIALVTTANFGKSFAKNFKELGGKFNKNLRIKDDKLEGWIFRSDAQTQEKVSKLLKDIHTGSLKPEFVGIIEPDFDEKTRNKKIVNMLTTIIEMTPENIEEYVVSEDENAKVTLYFNSDDTVVTEGECIYTLQTAHKKIELYQLKK